jgi:hypothetical protein
MHRSQLQAAGYCSLYARRACRHRPRFDYSGGFVQWKDLCSDRIEAFAKLTVMPTLWCYRLLQLS